MKQKNNSITEMVMPDNRLLALEKQMSGTNDNSQCEVESKGEKYISKLKKRGEAHLIVSALITTVTFAAGFTFPGGYKEDEGMAILTKKIAFEAFVATDTIAMVFSASAIFFHFLMKMHNEEDVVEKHLVWCECVCGCRECSPREEKRMFFQCTHISLYFPARITFGLKDPLTPNWFTTMWQFNQVPKTLFIYIEFTSSSMASFQEVN